MAVEINEELDVEERFGAMLAEVDEITEGRFELLIMNGDDLTSHALNEIEEGEIIYGYKKPTA